MGYLIAFLAGGVIGWAVCDLGLDHKAVAWAKRLFRRGDRT
jgi:hypothetical protein